MEDLSVILLYIATFGYAMIIPIYLI